MNSQRLVKDEGEKATALTIRDCISNLNSDFENLIISVVLFYVVISL